MIDDICNSLSILSINTSWINNCMVDDYIVNIVINHEDTNMKNDALYISLSIDKHYYKHYKSKYVTLYKTDSLIMRICNKIIVLKEEEDYSYKQLYNLSLLYKSIIYHYTHCTDEIILTCSYNDSIVIREYVNTQYFVFDIDYNIDDVLSCMDENI